MPTTYYCHGCGTKFLGDDPVHFKGGSPVFPECPNSPEAHYFAQFNLPEEQRDMPIDLVQMLDSSDAAHPVKLFPPGQSPAPTLGPPPVSKSTAKPAAKPGPVTNQPTAKAGPSAPQAKAPSPWASFKFKQPTKEEAKALAEEQALRDQQFAQDQQQADDRRLVDQLLARIDAMIQGGGSTASSNFPMDREYGTKASGNPLSAAGRIITSAGAAWVARSADHSFRDAKYKPKWDAYQANFELRIVPGDAAQGKHNVHVTRDR